MKRFGPPMKDRREKKQTERSARNRFELERAVAEHEEQLEDRGKMITKNLRRLLNLVNRTVCTDVVCGMGGVPPTCQACQARELVKVVEKEYCEHRGHDS